MLNPFRKLMADKLRALRYGRESEDRAARLLASRGYKLIERNFRCRHGEIDIIARQGRTLVFCEVKARGNRSFGTAMEGVTPAKMSKIRKTAEHYMQKKGLRDVDCRFDVVTIDGKGSGAAIDVVPNAF